MLIYRPKVCMNFISDVLGIGGGGNSGGAGMNYNAQLANVVQPVTTDQTNNLYNQSQAGLNQQQSFLNALQGQNGIQNQSALYGQEQNTANQLQGIANGTGPNPALAQLNNTTGANVANQAALMAGQRGAGQNVGLLARQAAMQGANTEQQAVGQGAALGAQQQLAGLSALQSQQGQMANLAGTQVGQTQNALTSYNSAALTGQNQLLGALGQYNNANVQNQAGVNNANAGVAQKTAGAQSGLLSGVGSALGSAAGMFAEGGTVPQSKVGLHLKGMVPGKAEVAGNSLKNDKVPAVLSPGEVVIPRSIMGSKDPAMGAAKFIQALMEKKKGKGA